MSRSLLFLITEYVCSAICLCLDIYEQKNLGEAVIAALAFFCLYLVCYILKQNKIKGVIISALLVSAGICGLIFCGENFPIPAVIIVLHSLSELLSKNYTLTAAVTVTLFFAVIKPPFLPAVISLSIAALTLAGVYICEKTELLQRELYKKGEEIAALKGRISALSEYSKTIKTAAAIEERSRFAVRIHDKLGHNISGSIILLEAAKLSLESSPAQARECISSATENLRQGVDEIREALRQERPAPNEKGKAEIESVLSEFTAKYGRKTELIINGDSEKINFLLWSCISENLKECLTNTLRHSGGDSFRVNISVMNKIIRCEFKDNGKPITSFKKGMGLTAIEERTAAAGGRTLFSPSVDGFGVILIFEISEVNS